MPLSQLSYCWLQGYLFFALVQAILTNNVKKQLNPSSEAGSSRYFQIRGCELRLLARKKSPPDQTREGVLGDILTDVQIKQAFQGTVIVGDSITESIAEYGFLDTSIVVAKLGLRIDDADDQINTAISLNPSVFFLSFGANDLEIYNGDSSAFIDAYRVKVKQIQNALPDTSIYINSILPIQQSAIDQSPALAYYDSFNQALRDFCDEMGCTFIDDSFLVDESMYEPDGEHMVYNYYPKWLTYMAEGGSGMKLNTKRNILSDFSGKLSRNLKKNKNQGTSILSDFKLTGSLIIKSVMVIFLVVYLGRLYVSDYAADVSMDKISAALEQVSGVTDLSEPGVSGLRRFYQIDENDIDSYFFRKAASPMSVDEVLVVKANSSSEASAYLEAAQAHLESQKNIFEGYGTDQMALLGEASVEKRGAYVWYFCGENAQELRQALLSMI